ncbi:MAG: hypothetical protein QMD85_04250, partial [Candidatus Aenigmarchaeota archaeon]|nr:hypothetical protein [Candidatus Aenigmarchaeota archaeon]MDI6722781.1 hypothetical protein [Candidatus Aenigmarchaeota archaeon]
LCYTTEGKYENNRKGTHLRFFPLHDFSFQGPVGPMRFTYILKFGDEKDNEAGIVAHNGEKIQESLPNIGMALFSRELNAYKLFCDPHYTEQRDNKEMTPNLANSIYSNGLAIHTGVKSAFLNNYDYPSAFRDTTVIVSSKNEAAHALLTGMAEKGYAVRIV